MCLYDCVCAKDRQRERKRERERIRWRGEGVTGESTSFKSVSNTLHEDHVIRTIWRNSKDGIERDWKRTNLGPRTEWKSTHTRREKRTLSPRLSTPKRRGINSIICFLLAKYTQSSGYRRPAQPLSTVLFRACESKTWGKWPTRPKVPCAILKDSPKYVYNIEMF